MGCGPVQVGAMVRQNGVGLGAFGQGPQKVERGGQGLNRVGAGGHSGGGQEEHCELSMEEMEKALIDGTTNDDETLKRMAGDDQGIPVYGDVELSSDELKLLKCGPKFNTWDKLCRADLETEFEIGLTKVRWDRAKHGYREEVEKEDEDPKLEEEIRLKEARDRETYTHESGTLNMANLRPTYMRSNRRVHIPKPRPPLEEAELMIRKDMWGKVVADYISEHCQEDGRQLCSNLTPAARRGLVSLLALSKKGEIVIYESDKCGRLCVTIPDSYRQQGRKHTCNDEAITWDEARLHQRMLNRTARAVAWDWDWQAWTTQPGGPGRTCHRRAQLSPK